ncbi:MAG: ribbon-helix-helix protein, CopG family [Acidimicrobiales bacterium]|nr:ribbon-helix-helix protein, CopG family [Actinomycetota bacterium]
MKTAISLPDETFRLATERAAQLGISRSELFSTAVRHYLDELDEFSLVSQIDAVAELANEDGSARTAVDAGRRLIAAETESW